MHPEKPYHPDEVIIFRGHAKLQRILQAGDIKLTPPPHPQAESIPGTFFISTDGRALCFVPDTDKDTQYILNLEEKCTYIVDPRTQELRPSLLAIADIEVDPDTPDIACISSWICAWLKENHPSTTLTNTHYN